MSMDSSYCTSSRQVVVESHLAGENAAGCNNRHVLSRELLFQLADEALLDLVEGREQPEGYVDDDGLATSSNIYLGRTSDEQILQLSFHVGLNLEIKDSASHELLESIGFGTTLFLDLVTLTHGRHPVTNHHTQQSLHQTLK